jgi:PAS domain S-box-containing protein
MDVIRQSSPVTQGFHSHSVQFYSEDTFLLEGLGRFIGTALHHGSSAVVIATQAHNENLSAKLKDLGIDVAAAIGEGRLQIFEAGEVLSRFETNGQIDAIRFFDIVGGVISKASAASRDENRQVVAFGEMVALLWAEGKSEAAIQLEQLWNRLAKTHSFSLHCAYPMQGFCQEQNANGLLKICSEHSAVIPDGSDSESFSDDPHLSDVIRLQQEAQSLKSEVEWRRSEERFKLFVDAVQDYAILMLDPLGRVTSWNAGAERIKGYKASEILGKHFSTFYPEPDRNLGKPQRLLDLASKNGRCEDEGWRVRKNGQQFWAHVTLTAVRDEAGVLIGFGKVTRDLTEQKRYESTVRRQEQRFQLFVQDVQDYALFMLDPDGYIVTWNLGAQRIKGYKASEIIGQHFSCFYPPEIRSTKPKYVLEVAAKEGRFEDEGWRLRKDGSRFWASVVITALRDADGKLTGFGKVTRDVTERMLAQKALEESQNRLRKSEKSLRELSARLLNTQDEERRRIGREIHDSLGQYLAVLKMKVDSLSSSQEAVECGNLIDECVKEVRTISYLLYPPMLEEMGLGSAIPWYLEGFSKRSGIKTTFQITDDVGRLSRDAELALFRVLQESLTNVQKHSGSSTAEIKIARQDNAVLLCVTDHGKGVPQPILEQDSKDWMGSHGIGLRGMSERLRQFGGSLEISSGESGTQVQAKIPL